MWCTKEMCQGPRGLVHFFGTFPCPLAPMTGTRGRFTTAAAVSARLVTHAIAVRHSRERWQSRDLTRDVAVRLHTAACLRRQQLQHDTMPGDLRRPSPARGHRRRRHKRYPRIVSALKLRSSRSTVNATWRRSRRSARPDQATARQSVRARCSLRPAVVAAASARCVDSPAPRPGAAPPSTGGTPSRGRAAAA